MHQRFYLKCQNTKYCLKILWEISFYKNNRKLQIILNLRENP